MLVGMNRGDRLQSDRGHGLHIDWGLCPGKMSYQWNRNNDLRGQELILDIFNPCRAHNEAVLAGGYFSAFSPT